jgi:hypothetical protein
MPMVLALLVLALVLLVLLVPLVRTLFLPPRSTLIWPLGGRGHLAPIPVPYAKGCWSCAAPTWRGCSGFCRITTPGVQRGTGSTQITTRRSPRTWRATSGALVG